MTETDSAITFDCTVAKVQTLADGGIRVTLDLPEGAILEAAQLIAAHMDQVYMTATLNEKRD